MLQILDARRLPIYVIISFCVSGLLVSFSILKHNSLNSAIQWLSFHKFSIAIFLNAGIALVLLILQNLLKLTVGPLRDLEIEQIMDHAKTIILDSILFLILASPTVAGEDVPHSILFPCLGTILGLKLYHHIGGMRVSHLLEAGITDGNALSKLTSLLCLLLTADIFLDYTAFRFAESNSSFYLWILFEAVGLTITSATSLARLSVLYVDLSLEAANDHPSNPGGIIILSFLECLSGWPLKNEYVFCLDVLHDVASLGCFLVFLMMFALSHPARLPIYLAGDVAHTSRQLVLKVQSFRRYKKLTARLEIDFPNASLEELEDADTCIICRDILTIGAKKLICGHILHFECLKGWFVHHQSCPTCRTEIPVGNNKSHTRSAISSGRSYQPGTGESSPTSQGSNFENADETIIESTILMGTTSSNRFCTPVTQSAAQPPWKRFFFGPSQPSVISYKPTTFHSVNYEEISKLVDEVYDRNIEIMRLLEEGLQ